jgi:hypothetical protein
MLEIVLRILRPLPCPKPSATRAREAPIPVSVPGIRCLCPDILVWTDGAACAEVAVWTDVQAMGIAWDGDGGGHGQPEVAAVLVLSDAEAVTAEQSTGTVWYASPG